jgi:hypothetical protein
MAHSCPEPPYTYIFLFGWAPVTRHMLPYVEETVLAFCKTCSCRVSRGQGKIGARSMIFVNALSLFSSFITY